jgi:predicted ATPase
VIHLQSVQLGAVRPEEAAVYPFSIPAVKALTTVEFVSPVTFLVGENGSGKSTFLEALALAAGSVSAGSDEMERDKSLNTVRALAKRLKLTWTKKTRKGFFLRAEDYFGYAKRLARMREELEADLRAVDDEYAERSAYARDLARMPLGRELHELMHK